MELPSGICVIWGRPMGYTNVVEIEFYTNSGEATPTPTPTPTPGAGTTYYKIGSRWYVAGAWLIVLYMATGEKL